MTDREKIIETLRASGYGYFITHKKANANEALADAADALIKAGYGDVKEWKERAGKHRVFTLPDGTIKQIYSNEEVEEVVRQRDEYKHRAEVAEKEREEYRRSNRIVLRGIEIIKRNIIRYCHTDLSNILLQAAREIEEEERE